MATSSTEAASGFAAARAERLAGLALVVGGLAPLWKQSLLFGSAGLVWPWQIAGLGAGLETEAALATAAGGEHLALWATLPFVGGVLALALSRVRSDGARGLAGAATGFGLLALLLLVFVSENAVLGLAFTPPTPGAGALTLGALVASAWLGAANHDARTAPPHGTVRALVAVAAVVVAATSGFFLLAAHHAWAALPMRILYVLALAYAGLGLGQALYPEEAGAFVDRSSLLARVILAWSPLAVVLSGQHVADGFVTYVVEAGGGSLSTATATIKGFLVFGGGALLLSAGLATSLGARRRGAAHAGGDAVGTSTTNAKLRVPTGPTGLRAPTRPAGALGGSAARGTVAVLLALGLGGCTASPPADLASAVASVGASVSPRRLERSAFYVAHPEGRPSAFVDFVFSPLGKAEWVPDDLRDVQGVALLDAERMLELGEASSVRAVALVQDRPDARLRHQVVLRADDARGMVVAAAYETWTAEPVLVREWKLPRVEVAAGVAEMTRENLDAGVDADGE